MHSQSQQFIFGSIFWLQDKPPHLDPAWVSTLFVWGLAGAISAIFGIVIGKRRKERLLERQLAVKQVEREFAGRRDMQDKIELLVSSSTANSSNVASFTATEYAESLAELRSQIALLSRRVENQRNEIVEVQRIDPVLEATLRLSVENLSKRIEAIERQSISKWDVALILLQLLGGLGVIAGVIFGIAKYLQK
jgi:hypothetical protein